MNDKVNENLNIEEVNETIQVFEELNLEIECVSFTVGEY